MYNPYVHSITYIYIKIHVHIHHDTKGLHKLTCVYTEGHTSKYIEIYWRVTYNTTSIYIANLVVSSLLNVVQPMYALDNIHVHHHTCGYTSLHLSTRRGFWWGHKARISYSCLGNRFYFIGFLPLLEIMIYIIIGLIQHASPELI